MKTEILNILTNILTNIQDYFTLGIIIFIIVNLINVMLSTMKSILTIKSTRIVASLFNALSYGFYALIIKSMANYDITSVVIITIVANLVGVYSSMWILDKFKKDKLWKVTVIPQKQDTNGLRKNLLSYELGFNEYPIITKYGNTIAFDIFTNSQKESATLKGILSFYENVKYHIAEIGKGL